MTANYRAMSRNVALACSLCGWYSAVIWLERGRWQRGKEGGLLWIIIGQWVGLLMRIWWY